MSYLGQQTNQQSLNGIIDLTDGTVVITDGDISNVKNLSLNGEINMNNNKIINLLDGSLPGDAVNKSQLDSISVNLSNYLKRDGSNSMTGNLNLSNNQIINVGNGINSTDGINKGQLDLKSDLTYVNTQLNLKSDLSYVNTQLNLKSDLSYVNSQLATKGNITYIDTQDNLRILKSGDTMTGQLNMSNNRIINVANGINSSDCINVLQLNNLSSDTSAGLNLKVNKSGDTMTGALNITADINISDTKNLYVAGKPNNDENGLRFHYNSTASNASVIDYKGDTFSIRERVAGSDVERFRLDTNNSTISSRTIINKNASTSISSYSPVSSYSLITGNTIYDYLQYSGSSLVSVFLPHSGGSDNSMVNKIVNISHLNASQISFVSATIGQTININGSSVSSTTFNFTSRKLYLLGLSTIGSYSVVEYNWNIPTNTDQLILQTSLGTDTNNEFTGIKFLNTSTDAGFIRVDTNRSHSDSNMSFQVRQGNTIINPLTLNSFVNANLPIITTNILLNGGTSDYQSSTVDSSNRTNTYLTLGPAGSGSDWAYLRQIGGSDDFHLSLDIHDNTYDGKFSLRTVESVANPDNIKTFFKATAIRGFFNPECIIIRPNNSDDFLLEDNKGITIVYAYGGQNGDIYLPDTKEKGMKIEVVNLTSQSLTVRSGVPGILTSLIKNGNASTTNSTVLDNGVKGDFIYNGSLWCGYKLGISSL